MIPRKKSRPITVDGKPYRWLCKYGRSRFIGTSAPTMHLTIQADAPNAGQVLQCFLHSKHPSAPHAQEDAWMYPEHKVSLLPRDVALVIRKALKSGWEPMKPGPAFSFDFQRTELTQFRVGEA